MKSGFNIKITVLWVLFAFGGCAQPRTDRQPYAAGNFYESNPERLKQNLAFTFEKAKSRRINHVVALISPHAGYVYSGETAASAYKQLYPEKKYENIFLIGSSHTMYLAGASVYTAGDYITPLGKVPVNIKLAKKLIDKNPNFRFEPKAHLREHSLENQLPFLQYYLKKSFKIVPIIIGTNDKEKLKSIAATLKPYLNGHNLFVVSSDFSHYPRYRDAQQADSTTAQGILSGDPDTFLKALQTNKQHHYPGLVTSACGWTSILTLLYITHGAPETTYIPIQYRNSGDVSGGDKSRVVGYFAFAVTQNNSKETKDFLSFRDKKMLLKIARITIESYLSRGIIPEIDADTLPENLKVRSGAFVTLNKNHRLRGCIGRFITDEPLYRVVQQMAVAAAVQDPRFPPVQPADLKSIEIEISVLTPLKKIKSIDEIRLGRDGIYIKKGNKSGTFLPQVASETGWSKEEFLGHCARDKAELGWNGWKDADIYTYQAIVFDESQIKTTVQ